MGRWISGVVPRGASYGRATKTGPGQNCDLASAPLCSNVAAEPNEVCANSFSVLFGRLLSKSVMDRSLELIGAPEEIRTPDPQIRSLVQDTDLIASFCK